MLRVASDSFPAECLSSAKKKKKKNNSAKINNTIRFLIKRPDPTRDREIDLSSIGRNLKENRQVRREIFDC